VKDLLFMVPFSHHKKEESGTNMSLVKSKFALLVSFIAVVLITLGIAVLPQTAYAVTIEQDGVTYEIDDLGLA
jgi:hypothetical protein